MNWWVDSWKFEELNKIEELNKLSKLSIARQRESGPLPCPATGAGCGTVSNFSFHQE